MAISSFYLSWWYTADTKLGMYFNNFGQGAQQTPLIPGATKGLDYTNGVGASVEEDYHFENLITQHPVETQGNISDNIIPQPRIITVTGLLTTIKTLIISGFDTGLAGHLDFSQLGKATQLLTNLYETRSGISLVTGLLYGSSFYRVDNLAVRSLDIPRNNQYGRSSIKFTITFEQLILTSQEGVLSSGYSTATTTGGVSLDNGINRRGLV